MEQEWIFSLRCYHSIGSGCPVECYREEGIGTSGFSYDECLDQARKEFRRRNSHCENVPSEQIEVLEYERG